ncbi:RNA polymerase sigma factor [Streptomyces sp. NPDC060333]|uniref:RNA polymerase sigma factor n=1 Tax=Streptomyces sp. NPDC060333 TaxID=3347098 RepID=UPI00365A365F
MVGEETQGTALSRGPRAGRVPEQRSGREADPLVLQELHDLYPDCVASLAWALRAKTGRKLSLQACQDVAQEAFLKVLDKAEGGLLEPGVNVEAYLRTTARNLAIDTVRSEGRLISVDGSVMEVLAETDEPLERYTDEMGDLVLPALAGMDVQERLKRILHLQGEGLSDVEIAAQLGISTARVHRDRYKVLAALRERLAGFVRDAHREQTRDMKKDG